MVTVLQSIPAIWRLRLYAVFVIVGVILGAVQVGTASLDNASQPDWLTVALVVYAYLGTALGFTAAVNVTPTANPASGNPPEDSAGTRRLP